MAVTQDSVIQVRRGRQADLPQLSPGELGFSVDELRLFIGNGNVSEGSPYEGNTEILTVAQLNNMLDTNVYITTILSDNTANAISSGVSVNKVEIPSGYWSYSLHRDGLSQEGIITFALSGTSSNANSVEWTNEFTGEDVGVNLSVQLNGSSIDLYYNSTSTGNDATIITTLSSLPITATETQIATVILENLTQTYTGLPIMVSALTVPPNLSVFFTYNSSNILPVEAGIYQVIGTVQTTGYEGYAGANLIINQATPKINWVTPTNISAETALSNIQLNATANIAGTFDYSPDAGTILIPGVYTLTANFTPSDSTNYAYVITSVPLRVNQIQPSIQWATPNSINYGTALSNIQLNATANIAGTFDYSPDAGTILPAGNSIITANFVPTDSVNYAYVITSINLNINQIQPSIQWATPNSINYGTALSNIQLNATANIAGTFDYSPDAGTILIPGNIQLFVEFTPTDFTNYASTSATVTLLINKIAPLLSWVPSNPMTPNSALSSDQLNATANVPGTFSYNPTFGTILPAGQNLLMANFIPNNSSLYNSANASVIETVQTIPSIQWATPNNIVFGTALSNIQLNATSSVAGSFVYFPAAGTILSIGSHLLIADFSPTDTFNYSSAVGNVTIIVTAS